MLFRSGDTGSIPGSGSSPGGGHGNSLQCSCLENTMDRGSSQAAKSDETERLTMHWLLCIDAYSYLLYIFLPPLCFFSSVAESCPTLCDPMNRSMPGLPVHHQLPEFTQTHVHRVGDAIQPSHPLLSPSPPAPNPSQYQSLFQ